MGIASELATNPPNGPMGKMVQISKLEF